MPNPSTCTWEGSWRGVTMEWIFALLYHSCAQSKPTLGKAQFSGLSSHGVCSGVTAVSGAGSDTTSCQGQARSWTTVCSHPHIKEIISLVNNITLTMETASCPPVRELLPLLWSCASAEPSCPHCLPQLTALQTVLPISCKDPLAFCPSEGRVENCVFIVVALSPLHSHQPSDRC